MSASARLPRISVHLYLILCVAVVSAFLGACSPSRIRDQAGIATGTQGVCEDGEQASGAKYRICMPTLPPWNGDLVVYAHGYVAYNEPVAIPEDQLVVGDVSLPDVINAFGYAFATTSYYTNGLAVRAAIPDLVDLVDVFVSTQAVTPTRVYLTGASEGGLITALALEEHPEVFDGGLAACGPLGGLQPQVDYLGDLRVVFDYYFPELMPGPPITIPQWLIDGWEPHYATVIEPVISSPTSAYSLTQLLDVAGAAYEPELPTTMVTTTQGALWYNVFATNDAKAKLGGQPFDNSDRVYSGSDDDARLNTEVQRLVGDQAALDEMEAHYQPTGQLGVPMVTIHTTLDEIVPYWHEALYHDRAVAAQAWPWLDSITVPRYGHCSFLPSEVVQAFLLLVQRVENARPDLSTSRIRVVDTSSDGVAQAGETLSYTIAVTNSGTVAASVTVTNVLPVGLAYVPGSLAYVTPGITLTASFSGGQLVAHTEGAALDPAAALTIAYEAQVGDPLPAGRYLVNGIELQDQERSYAIPPSVIATRYLLWLPVVARER
jgi:uncharacterized repeat protein (TIGR01451 family)